MFVSLIIVFMYKSYCDAAQKMNVIEITYVKTSMILITSSEQLPAKSRWLQITAERRLQHTKIIVGIIQLLVLYILLPNFIRYITTGGNTIAPRPQILPPESLPQRRKLRQ